MIVPDKLKSADTAFLLRVQNSMCTKVRDDRGCIDQDDCSNCMLNADLKVFGKWLHKQTKESLK